MTIKQIIKSRKIRSFLMDNLGSIPDSLYVSLFYFAACGKWPNLKDPKGYNEKLNWLKLHEDYSKYSDYCDKLKVREIIQEKLGDGYMFPILGYWKSFDEIDFDKLPDEFVLKCNHDSGSTKVIKNKNDISERDRLELKTFFDRRISRDFFSAGREPCYKGIEKYIIAEPFMKNDDSDEDIRDYKFLCFNGKAEIMYVNSSIGTQHYRDFFDMEYKHLDVTNLYPQSDLVIEKPKHFEKMKNIVDVLAKDMKTVRIDLYEINDKIYFGEYTFFHCGGFCLFHPDEWEMKLGDLIQID